MKNLKAEKTKREDESNQWEKQKNKKKEKKKTHQGGADFLEFSVW